MARDWLKLPHLRMPDVKPLYDLKTKFIWKELRNDTINNNGFYCKTPYNNGLVGWKKN